VANEAELVGLTTSGDIKPIVATMDLGTPRAGLFTFCFLLRPCKINCRTLFEGDARFREYYRSRKFAHGVIRSISTL